MNEFKGQRVLVTGVSGFVGWHLLYNLHMAGARVCGLVRAESDHHRVYSDDFQPELAVADLADHKALQQVVSRLQPDYIFHSAVHRNMDEPLLAIQANIGGSLALLAASGSRLKKFIHLGSSLEYGLMPEFRESEAGNPLLPFGSNKLATTLSLRAHARSTGQPLVIVRLFHVYGQREPLKRLIPRAILAGLKGTSLPLTGRGCVHDFIYISDVIEACRLAALSEYKQGEIFNAGSGVATDNVDVVNLIAQKLGRPVNVEPLAFKPRPFDHGKWVADTRLSVDKLGFRAKISLTDGLEGMISWVKEWA